MAERTLDKIKVLFVCVHNSSRSQMAEEILRKLASPYFHVESAGLEPGNINPIVVEVLKELDIDISQKRTKSVHELLKQGKMYHYAITVCDDAHGERCPVFSGVSEKLHWPFADPSKFSGSYEERLVQTRKVRNQIQKKIEGWLATLSL